MFGIPGWMEIGIIGIIILLLFGKRIPETMRSLARGIVEFKKGLKEVPDEDKKAKDRLEDDDLLNKPDE